METSKIKLLEFIHLFYIGGTERQFVNLGQALDGSKFELHFACLEREGEYLKEIEALGAPLVEHRISSLLHGATLREQLRFARYLKQHRIQIMHSYSFYPNFFAVPAARLAGVPVIIASIRDTGVYLTPMRRRAQRIVCRLAHRIVANSEAVKSWLISEGYDAGKIAVIRNGIDISRFVNARRDGRVHRELGIPSEAPLIGMICRLKPLKGIDYFLEAAAIVLHRFPDARFLIVGGDGDDRAYRRELEGYARDLALEGRVFFMEFRLDVPEVLAELALSVLPSLSEGLPNSVLEAMAAGVPVVATRVGGNPEAVEDGVSGLLVPPQDSAALARAMCRILRDPELASRFGQVGRRRVAEQFSIERMTRATEGLYLELLQRQGMRQRTALRDAEASGF
ncbi:MAG: GT4 family glycosyltransferase PelF [Deltaproteobacteria bacterium]|nr:GT4 family glycosyltransferase PelF [Deltaproteobacteria bacterium]